MKTRAQKKQEQLCQQRETEEMKEIAEILLSMKREPVPPVPQLHRPISVLNTEIESLPTVHTPTSTTMTTTTITPTTIVRERLLKPTPKYPVNIDFNESSREWMRNKLKKGNGMYQYRCIAITTIGKQCVLQPIKGRRFCYIHRFRE
jgi:hypothetical protein